MMVEDGQLLMKEMNVTLFYNLEKSNKFQGDQKGDQKKACPKWGKRWYGLMDCLKQFVSLGISLFLYFL